MGKLESAWHQHGLREAGKSESDCECKSQPMVNFLFVCHLAAMRLMAILFFINVGESSVSRAERWTLLLCFLIQLTCVGCLRPIQLFQGPAAGAACVAIRLLMKKVISAEVIHTNSCCWALRRLREIRFLQDAVTPKGNALHLNGGSSLYTDTQTCFWMITVACPSSHRKGSDQFWIVWKMQG